MRAEQLDRSIWYNTPGVLAAHQAIGAPNLTMSLTNAAENFRLTNYLRFSSEQTANSKYPVHSPFTGWTFNGTNTVLRSRLFRSGVSLQMSFIVRFSNGTGTGYRWIGGVMSNSQIVFDANNGKNTYYVSGQAKAVTKTAAGILGVVPGVAGYRNGIPEVAFTQQNTTYYTTYGLGCFESGLPPVWDPYYFFNGKIQAALLVDRKLTATEMNRIYIQMKYCETNPIWNAWATKQPWFFFGTSIVSAGRVGVYGQHSTVGLSGGVSIRGVN